MQTNDFVKAQLMGIVAIVQAFANVAELYMLTDRQTLDDVDEAIHTCHHLQKRARDLRQKVEDTFSAELVHCSDLKAARIITLQRLNHILLLLRQRIELLQIDRFSLSLHEEMEAELERTRQEYRQHHHDHVQSYLKVAPYHAMTSDYFH